MNKYTTMCTRIHVIILYHIVDYYISTIDDMQSEMDSFYHCKKFEYIHDFEIFFLKKPMTHWNSMFQIIPYV